MNYFHNFPVWLAISLPLFVLALFFKFCMRGYDYIAYALLFIMALVLLKRFAPVNIRRIAAILVCIGLLYLCAVEIPIVKNGMGDEDCERKYLIVLGAAVHGDTPSLALTHRLEGALDYLNKHPESMAILSGGKGKGENISEAECMYYWLTLNGISSDRLIMEPESTSTAENLSFSFDIIRSLGDEPDGNVCILSSSYHLYRAKCIAALMGVEARGVPGNPGYPIYMLNCYIREAFGITYLMVFGI